MGSSCLFTRQQTLEMGYFYWLHVNISILFPCRIVLVTCKTQNFILKVKLLFPHISSIASFTPFLIARLWEYCTFSDSSVISFKSSPWPKYTQYGTITQNISMFCYETLFFSSLDMFFIRLLLANTWKKIGGTCLREKKYLFRHRA